MKTAISIPDEVFREAERLARRTGRSRSELYSLAVAEYVARHAPAQVTEAMDRTLDSVDGSADEFIAEAGRRALKRSEW